MNKSLKYEYLPHTADVRFRAYGKTLEEAFTNAAVAMFNVMVDTHEVKAKTTKKIAAEGNDLESLLQSFLEQFIILLDTDNFFLSKIKELKISSRNKGTNRDSPDSASAAADAYRPEVDSAFGLSPNCTAAPLSTLGKSKYSLTAVAAGDEAKNYETIGPQVKACTYNSMFAKQEGRNWVVQVVVDI